MTSETDKTTIRVGIVEDSTVYRREVRAVLAGAQGFACVGDWGSAEKALNEFSGCRPDVMLVDIQLPGMGGIECLRRVKALSLETQCAILTIHDDSELIFQA